MRAADRRAGKTGNQGFTLIELLVVIAIIAILAALLIPALKEARETALKVGCSTRMHSWGTAVYNYSADHNNQFPLYAWTIKGRYYEADVWINTLSAYLGGETLVRTEPAAVQAAKRAKNAQLDVRRCPTGDAFVGCHYNRPFFWLGNDGGRSQPFAITDFHNPSGWIAFMDTYDGWGMYSPRGWRFNADYDGDGIKDTYAGTFQYNYAMPRVHLEGMNVVMIDGHAEWMPFKDFLNPDHPNWTDDP